MVRASPQPGYPRGWSARRGTAGVITVAFGVAWILHALELALKDATTWPVLQKQNFLASRVLLATAAIYFSGAISSALLFGYLTHCPGARGFFVTPLGIYLLGTLSWLRA